MISDESGDSDVPETVLQFGGNPRTIIQQQILVRNPRIRVRTDSEQTSVDEETEDQRRRRLDRKDRNRTAARKCREKKEQRATELEAEVAELEMERDRTMAEVAELQREWDALQHSWHDHPCPLNNNNNNNNNNSSHNHNRNVANHRVVIGLQPENNFGEPGEPAALDTPTDENERSLINFHQMMDSPSFAVNPNPHREAMDTESSVDGQEFEPFFFLNADELNTPVVEREILFNL